MDKSMSFDRVKHCLSKKYVDNTFASGAAASIKLTGYAIAGSPSLPLATDSLNEAVGKMAKTIDTNSNLLITGYAEMYMYDNVTLCAIDVANVYHAVYNSFGNNDSTLAPNRDATAFTYKAGAGYSIASVANYNSPTNTLIKCTTTAPHTFLAGEPITITGSANYDGTYLVQADGLTETEFVVLKTYVATNTGSARRPATLKCLTAGVYSAGFNVSGNCVSDNDVFKFELNKSLIHCDNICARVLWTSGETVFRSASCTGLCVLTVGQYVWLSVKNYSGTGDLTIRSANVCLHRVA
jgi:hypothetical protein